MISALAAEATLRVTARNAGRLLAKVKAEEISAADALLALHIFLADQLQEDAE